MSLSKEASFQNSEDIDINSTVEDLFDRFIKPIDSIRSISKPIVSSSQQTSTNDFTNLQVSNTEIFESRTSAFYRMLGFPIVGGDAFYNAGFDPNFAKTSDKKQKIKSAFLQNNQLYNLIQQREFLSVENKRTFLNQDIKSSLYSLLIRYVPPFKIISTKEPFEVDSQLFTLTDRTTEINLIADSNSSLKDSIISAGSGFVSGKKILKPFIVDPKVDSTVMPTDRNICVPFLVSKNQTQIENNIYLNRPGIEAILRQRLMSSTVDSLFLKQVENIIKQKKQPGIDIDSLSSFSLVDTLQALSEDNKITDKTKNSLNGITDIQVSTINNLTKIIKFLIKELISSIEIIDRAIYEIYWFPIPSKDGPITGRVGSKLGSFGLNGLNISSVEQKILELKIKKLNAERQVTSFQDLGTFASPFDSNSTTVEDAKNYSSQIDELENKKNRISDNAFDALKKIEMIVGEIAGIGLIDVLSIYLVLWSVDIKTLIHFLDDEAFDRMYVYNSSFQSTKEISERKVSGSQMKISEVLKSFEQSLINIQFFVDKTFQIYIGANKNILSGSP